MVLKEELVVELERARQRYDDEVKQILSKTSGPDSKYVTPSGTEIKPLYTPEDLEGIDYLEDLSFPGQYPFTRGAYSAGYLSRDLHIRPVTGFGTAEETNARWQFLLDRGINALAFVCDDGSGCRADSDDERVRGLVGAGGVALDTLYDYETLFDGIDMRKYPVHMITGAPYALACYIALAQSRGIDLKDLRGSMSNSFLPGRQCLDIMEYATLNMPLFNAGYVDMRNVREGGCTAAQEIAFGVGLSMAICDKMMERGIQAKDFLHRVSWFVNAGPELFEEVAKFRALRKVWAKIFRERYDVQDPRSLLCRMHCQVYAPSMTMQQPFNNLIRGTVYALAGIMGGVQSLHVNAFDEALGIPTEFSAALSVRTQQIIDLETGITKVVDPLGGSYYIEWLTKKLEDEAMAIIDKIQGMGGAFKAFNWMCSEVRREAIKSQQDLDASKKPMVGVNILVEEDDIQTRALKTLQEHADFDVLSEYSPELAEKQIARLNKVKSERDPQKVETARNKLIEVMKAGHNPIALLVEAVKNGLTRGEYAQMQAEIYNMPGSGPYVCDPGQPLA